MSENSDNTVTGLQLSNNTYNNAKFIVQIVMPALTVLYATLSEFWGFPKVQEIVGSINAIALFLGIVLRISSASYAQTAPGGTPVGTFLVTQDTEGKKSIKLELDQDPEEFIGKGSIAFNVRKETSVEE